MAQENFDQKSLTLNEQQLQMLNLFKKPMSDQDFDRVKRFIVKILAMNIDAEMSELEAKNNWSAETYEQWGQEHLRTHSK